jgi:hypothetical protein
VGWKAQAVLGQVKVSNSVSQIPPTVFPYNTDTFRLKKRATGSGTKKTNGNEARTGAV